MADESKATPGADLLAAHRQEFAIGDDDSPLDHHVAHGARRERVDHVLRQRLKRPKRRIAEVEADEIGAVAGGDAAHRQPEHLAAEARAHREAFLGGDRLAVQARHLLQQRAGAHLVEHRDAAVGAAAVGAESDADAEGCAGRRRRSRVARNMLEFGL